MNEKGKINISTIFLILAIIIIVVMGFFFYKLYNEKISETNKSSELEEKINMMNSNIVELQEKIGSISNIISNNNMDNSNAEDKEYKIEGTYLEEITESNSQTERAEYIFSGDKVEFRILGYNKGTFVIEGNKLIITFNEFYTPEGIQTDGSPKTEEFTIVDNNTIARKVGENTINYIKK